MNEPRPPEVKPITESVPEVWTVEKDVIYAAKKAIECGLEYARDCLIAHDVDLGRTTPKNQMWAEKMERDIDEMKSALEMLINAK